MSSSVRTAKLNIVENSPEIKANAAMASQEQAAAMIRKARADRAEAARVAAERASAEMAEAARVAALLGTLTSPSGARRYTKTGEIDKRANRVWTAEQLAKKEATRRANQAVKAAREASRSEFESKANRLTRAHSALVNHEGFMELVALVRAIGVDALEPNERAEYDTQVFLIRETETAILSLHNVTRYSL